MKKRNLVVGNWKMNPETSGEAKEIFSASKKAALPLKNTDIVICPPFLYLSILSKSKMPKNIFLGSQNISSESKGAFTGEVSATMVKNMGANYSIIGHSERRAMGESDEIIRKKMQSAFNEGLTPILCIGEKTRDKEGAYLGFVKNQIKECLTGLQKKNLVGLIIAYEPIWAIGKSYKDAMNPTDVHEMTLFIKKSFGEFFGRDTAGSIKILYGAAVEAENTKTLFEQGNIDGLLVGHASLNPGQFSEILKAADMKR